MERAPEAVAAVCAGRELTYGELEARSNRLARLLRERGIGRGAPVGVWVERSLDMLTAVFGVLKAGAHYVAFDEAWPADRIESILAATGAPAIVAGPDSAGRRRGDALAAAGAVGRDLPGDRGGGAAGRGDRRGERARAVGPRRAAGDATG